MSRLTFRIRIDFTNADWANLAAYFDNPVLVRMKISLFIGSKYLISVVTRAIALTSSIIV